MKKLSKDQKEQRDKLVDAVRGAADTLEQALAEFNDSRESVWDDYEEAQRKVKELEDDAEAAAIDKAADEALDAYNEAETGFEDVDTAHGALCDALAELRDFRDEIVGDMQAYFDDKSERWQQSEAGSAYSSWMDAWAEADLDDPNPYTFMEMTDDSTRLQGLLDDSVVDRLGLDELSDNP